MKSLLSTLLLGALVVSAAPQVRAGSPEKTQAAATQAAPKVFASAQKEGAKATCPITGEQFVIAKDTLHAEYKGKHVYFCCPGCKTTFDKDPAKYTK
jgi:xanthine dehydrogenase accessory factor